MSSRRSRSVGANPSRKKGKQLHKVREEGFQVSSGRVAIPDYNALYDSHLRHYFENRRIQSYLYRTGLIDRDGRVIDVEKNKSKLHIIEQEFRHAEKAEYWRLKEEEVVRRRIQAKRQDALEATRKAERLAKLKEDRRLRQELLHARMARSQTELSNHDGSRYGSPGARSKTSQSGRGLRRDDSMVSGQIAPDSQDDVDMDGMVDGGERYETVTNQWDPPFIAVQTALADEGIQARAADFLVQWVSPMSRKYKWTKDGHSRFFSVFQYSNGVWSVKEEIYETVVDASAPNFRAIEDYLVDRKLVPKEGLAPTDFSVLRFSDALFKFKWRTPSNETLLFDVKKLPKGGWAVAQDVSNLGDGQDSDIEMPETAAEWLKETEPEFLEALSRQRALPYAVLEMMAAVHILVSTPEELSEADKATNEYDVDDLDKFARHHLTDIPGLLQRMEQITDKGVDEEVIGAYEMFMRVREDRWKKDAPGKAIRPFTFDEVRKAGHESAVLVGWIHAIMEGFRNAR